MITLSIQCTILQAKVITEALNLYRPLVQKDSETIEGIILSDICQSYIDSRKELEQAPIINKHTVYTCGLCGKDTNLNVAHECTQSQGPF